MGDGQTFVLLLPVLVVLLSLVLRSLRQVDQWEVALRFTLGKFSGRVEPGIALVLPFFQSLVKADTRVRNRDLPQQMVITADNVTAVIDAVVYYRVVDPEKAILNLENYELAIKDRAKVVLRDIVGETLLDDVLAHREEIAAKVRTQVEQFVAHWGLHVETIALQDIQLPPEMREVIARKAIAERDRQYVIIKSQADVESAKNFAEAARILADSPGAMELRRLEALQNISGHGVTKVVFDLARPPQAGDGDKRALAMALAMEGDGRTGVRMDAGGHPAGAQPMGTQPAEVARTEGYPTGGIAAHERKG